MPSLTEIEVYQNIKHICIFDIISIKINIYYHEKTEVCWDGWSGIILPGSSAKKGIQWNIKEF